MSARSLTLYESTRTFSIAAELAPVNDGGLRHGPILYIETSVLAVVEYCLLNQRSRMLDNANPLRLDLRGEEHLEMCFRMRRCGAVKLNPVPWDEENSCRNALADQLYQTSYLFGWPTPSSNNSDGQQSEPVWVYYISPLGDSTPTSDAIRFHGMEALLGSYWLRDCSNIEEYCERLKIHGAVYYSDVRNSPEARQMGIIFRPTTLEDV